MDPKQINSQQTDSAQNYYQQQHQIQQRDFKQLHPELMSSLQQDPTPQTEALDADEVPPEYHDHRANSGRRERPNNPGHDHRNPRNNPKDQRALPSYGPAKKVDHTAQAIDSPGNFVSQSINNLSAFFTSTPKRPSIKHESEQQRHKRQHNKEHLHEEVNGGEGQSGQNSLFQNDIIELKEEYQEELRTREREWAAREQELQHCISQVNRRLEENTRIFQAKLRESEAEKSSMREQHNAFIRKQQEASFRQMESARWLPMDEGKVMSNLDRLRRDMRTWAKTTCVKDISKLQSIGETESGALRQDLSNVVRFENGQLPPGLFTTARSSTLLLNALLSHHVYSSFFRSPFFFLGYDAKEISSNVRPESMLEDIYERAQNANQEDAHTWRSQTLRMLMPPQRNDAPSAETELRRTTEESISHVADQQASDFLASPACYLIKNETEVDFKTKLRKIYGDAAKLSYMLWTRRTQMRCFTLVELKDLTFDAESSEFEPDSLVKWEDHADHLKDKLVTVMVHPLLKVYGTDEAKDYDQERVWVKGIVWLDSKES